MIFREAMSLTAAVRCRWPHSDFCSLKLWRYERRLFCAHSGRPTYLPMGLTVLGPREARARLQGGIAGGLSLDVRCRPVDFNRAADQSRHWSATRLIGPRIATGDLAEIRGDFAT